MLIAAHSGYYEEDDWYPYKYWIGDSKCGWDSCVLDISANVSKERSDPIPKNLVNVGIPLPMDLVAGDTIRLCGMYYTNDPDSQGYQYGAAIGRFNCETRGGSGEYTVTNLTYNETLGTIDDQTGCFNIAYSVPSAINRCNNFFVVGLNVKVTGGSTWGVKFTYTLHITRSCS
jgi:hypothetical protein